MGNVLIGELDRLRSVRYTIDALMRALQSGLVETLVVGLAASVCPGSGSGGVGRDGRSAIDAVIIVDCRSKLGPFLGTFISGSTKRGPGGRAEDAWPCHVLRPDPG